MMLQKENGNLSYLWQLRDGKPQQPNELEKSIHDINQKMLLEQLGELLSCGMVKKEVFEGYPLRTEYALTERGIMMLEAITIMQSIGIDLMKENNMMDKLSSLGFID